MNKRTSPRPKGRLLLTSVLTLLGLALLAAWLLPRFLAHEATQAPRDQGTFVTRQLHHEPLQSRLQASLAQSQNRVQTEPKPSETDRRNPDGKPLSEQKVEAFSSTSLNFSSSQAASTPASGAPSEATQTQPQDAPPPASALPRTGSVPQGSTDKEADFQVQISESEISSLVYNGLYSGIAPQYRQALQGVSTRIQNGRAKVTVALLPRYLPDAFLRNLPGINHDTGTVYLGGEVGLSQAGNSVQPVIYGLNLGSLSLPMPFVQSAMRTQVQAYIRHLLTLPDGRQARLQKVQVQNGAVTLSGDVR